MKLAHITSHIAGEGIPLLCMRVESVQHVECHRRVSVLKLYGRDKSFVEDIRDSAGESASAVSHPFLGEVQPNS